MQIGSGWCDEFMKREREKERERKREMRRGRATVKPEPYLVVSR